MTGSHPSKIFYNVLLVNIINTCYNNIYSRKLENAEATLNDLQLHHIKTMIANYFDNFLIDFLATHMQTHLLSTSIFCAY